MSAALSGPVVAPLLGALLGLVAGRRAARWLAWPTLLATLAASAWVAAGVHAQGVLTHAVGGWGAPLGIHLRADGVAALTLVCCSAVAVLTCAPVLRARPEGHPLEGLLPLWFLAWAALNALLLSADIFNLYVTLELLTLSAVGLIALERGADAARAALRYLLFALAGSLVYLLGVGLLYARFATLELAGLGQRVDASPAAAAALALVALGLALKAALFPLHGWLPAAYVSARSTVSALLSALVSFSPFYVLLRVWLEVVPAALKPTAGAALGALGAAGVLWGSVLALRQRRLRPLIAYSSVAQVGYLFMVLPLGSAEAVAGGIFLVISHAAAKASLFVAAGTLRAAVGHDRLWGLRGLTARLPLTFFSVAVAGVSLMGLPPSGGFVAKWLLVRAALASGQWWWAAVILAGGLLAAGYVFKVLRVAFLPPPVRTLRAVPRVAELSPFGLALLALLLGLAPRLPLELLAVGLPP